MNAKLASQAPGSAIFLGGTQNDERIVDLGILLGGYDSAQRVTSREDDAAMVHLGRGRCRLVEYGCICSLNDRAAACGAPVPLHLRPKHRMTVAANALHLQRLPDQTFGRASAVSTHRRCPIH
jgi:hypothetical protein